MIENFQIKERYGIDDLLRIMEILRSENGCPWDREQNHQSLRSNMIEEAYEAVEAIVDDDMEHLREELGDVLLQVVFHAQMEAEEGRFTFDDVADGICQKLIVRHPHIFSDTKAKSKELCCQESHNRELRLRLKQTVFCRYNKLRRNASIHCPFRKLSELR